jgi:hypothetical protein
MILRVTTTILMLSLARCVLQVHVKRWSREGQCHTGDAAIETGVAWLFLKTISDQRR